LFPSLAQVRRAYGHEVSACSLRDVVRCLSLLQWFLRTPSPAVAAGTPLRSADRLKRAIVLALSATYYMRSEPPRGMKRCGKRGGG